MKNWKCIIGATLLMPVCVAFGIGSLVGSMWLMENVPIMHYIMYGATGIAILAVFATMWFGLFNHCKSHWQKKKGKGVVL